jgi:hypothetical protein
MQFFPDMEKDHMIKSLFYLVVSIAIIALSVITGLVKGSTPGLLLFGIGAVLFFYAVPHFWGNAKYYVIEFAVLFGIYTLMWIYGSRLDFWREIKTQGHLEEDVAWFLGGLVIEAFIGIIAGTLIFSEGSRHLLYPAVTIGLAAVFIMFPQCLFISSSVKPSILITAWFFLGFQFIILAALFRIASIHEKDSGLTRIFLLVSAILLILMAIWGLLVKNETHWMTGIRLWAFLEIITGIMALYTFANISRSMKPD